MASSNVSKKPRRVKTAKYRSFRLSKRLKNTRPKLPSAWTLTKNTVQIIRTNWKVFGGITLVYALLTVFLVRGVGAGEDIAGVKEILQEDGVASNAQVSLQLFGGLLSGGSGLGRSETAGVYQSIVTLLSSMAMVWAFRHYYGSKKPAKIRVRDAFYKGMYPLIPVLLVLVVIGLQLLPVSLSSGIYSTMIVNGLAVTAAEKAFWIIIMILLVMLSIYMVSASLIALLAVTLPNVTPMEALRGAKKYVEHRRYTVIAKLLWMTLGVVLVLALIVLPLIAFLPTFAEFVFFVCASLLLPFTIGYCYNLYRALLK